jgi:hypothetical protein
VGCPASSTTISSFGPAESWAAKPPKDKKGELRVLQQGMHIFQEISAILYSH